MNARALLRISLAGTLFALAGNMAAAAAHLRPPRVHHIMLIRTGPDGWNTKLKAEGVNFIEETRHLGGTRAFMIEGPSREQIEIVEVR